MEKGYDKTLVACFIGYVVQAIINNFAPLLFLYFNRTYGIPLTQITLLVTLNFGLQLVIDLVSVTFVDKIGYRASMLIAHGTSAVGLLLMTVLPDVCPTPFIGLLISVAIYAVGGGLLEVLVSPVVEACPTAHKEQAMSLLHSFYCWGHVAVVLLTTVFFYFFGIDHWKILAVLWALVPLGNLLLFARVPIGHLVEEGETGMRISDLIRNGYFWILLIMMMCAGASEQSVSQWASTFAEKGLRVSKTIGDLAGPMAFAILMGSARAIYGKFGEKIPLDRFMFGSVLLCILSYLCIGLCNRPVIALLACAVCGFSVGIMWPGTFSKAAASLKNGGTALFALLALGGDLGCSGGPTLVGLISGTGGERLRMGILCAVCFPVMMGIGVMLLHRRTKDL